jgi:hypothetical protein
MVQDAIIDMAAGTPPTSLPPGVSPLLRDPWGGYRKMGWTSGKRRSAQYVGVQPVQTLLVLWPQFLSALGSFPCAGRR